MTDRRSTRQVESRRLAACLASAMVLHLVLLECLPGQPTPFLSKPVPPLLLHWRPRPAALAPSLPQANPEVLSPDSNTPKRTSPARPPVHAPGTSKPQPLVSSSIGTNITPSATSLMDSARRIAREQGRETERNRAALPQDRDPLLERPFAPQLDQAVRRGKPGETRLSGGLIKVTTTTGQVYCLQLSPEALRGGPVEMLALPSTCP